MLILLRLNLLKNILVMWIKRKPSTLKIIVQEGNRLNVK